MLIAGLTLILWLPSAASQPQRFEAVEAHMGTLVRITVYAPEIETARTAIAAGFARIRALDETLSDYKPESELRRLPGRAVGRDVRISADLFRVLEASQQLAVATDGAFDVTLGPVTRLWREARRSGQVPEQTALRQAASRSGYRKLHLDAAARTARVDAAGMALDVGAIGKGFAASEALAAIDDLGIASALVAISGDLACSGAPPGRPGWRIGLHALAEDVTSIPQTVMLTNAAISTSGNAAQHLDIGDTRYSHIVDPSTSMGVTADVTVTVIATDGLQADGLDTAVSIVGAERGLSLVERYPDAAALVIARRGGEVDVRTSSRFDEVIARGSPRQPSAATARASGGAAPARR